MAERVVTVFGGSGFIGRYLVQRLARQGWIIRVAVRHPQSALFLKPCGDVGQIVPLAASLQREESIAAAVEGATAVVNLVGILYERGRQTFRTVHVEGAERVARAAAAAGFHFGKVGGQDTGCGGDILLGGGPLVQSLAQRFGESVGKGHGFHGIFNGIR